VWAARWFSGDHGMIPQVSLAAISFGERAGLGMVPLHEGREASPPAGRGRDPLTQSVVHPLSLARIIVCHR
jgi:hypothetical protein